MYNENERSHFFRDLIVKILLVLLFVFLIMWLVPMPNLNPFYDKVFTQNMNSMTDAAKSYYTTARLPKVEGETRKLTLGDMIDNKMIIEFTDSNGKKCDNEKSYVEVTKKGGEYIYKTNLSCSKQSDYVIEYFGCYDICANGQCDAKEEQKEETKPSDNSTTKKVTEYQFSKKTTNQYIDKYTCKNGYTLKGDKCIVVTEIEKQENANIKCLSGYSYNNSTKKCEKLDTAKEEATLTCPKGYIYATSLDKCIKGSEDEVDATLSYKCSEGTLVGTKCAVADTKITDAEKVYSCSEGTLNGTKCKITTTKEVDAEKVYSCSEGTLNGTKCVITTTKEVDAEKVYTCSEGTLNGTKCKITIGSVKVKYTCSEGTLNDTNCVIVNKGACGYTKWVCSNKTYTTSVSTSSTPTFTRRFLYQIGTSRVYEECNRVYKCAADTTTTVAAKKTYYCTSGTMEGSYCTKEVDAKLTYKCANGTLNGTKCTILEQKEVDAKLTYKCANGTLNGTKCKVSEQKEVDAKLTYRCTIGALTDTNKCLSINTRETAPTKVYSCPVGKLNGTKCEITGIDSTEKVYTCKYGTLSGKYCVITTTDSREPIYYCKAGYTLADKKCYVTESSTDIVNATPVYKTKTETVYKWSRSENLEGWTRTGKTRTVEVAIVSRGY